MQYDGHKRRTSDYEDQQKERWHIGKEIPLSLIFAIIVQTGGFIWGLATLTAKVDDLSIQMAAASADRYTATDAKKDGALYLTMLADHNRRIEIIERKTK